MEKNKAKLFVCHHPGNLLLFKNLAMIVRKYDKDIKIILFKVNHPYFSDFNLEPYKKYFDKTIEIDFISYRKNFLIGFWEMFSFQKKVKKATSDFLAKFETIDLFLSNSAWLPVNILLYNLSKEKNIKNIVRFTLVNQAGQQVKIAKLKTFLLNLYHSPLKCYKINALSALDGRLIDFDYNSNVPGKLVKIVHSFAEIKNQSANSLPFPIVTSRVGGAKKDMVIVFGDEGIYQFFSEYLPNYEMFVEGFTKFFKTLEKKYPDCQLYYNPHPGDKNIMPGVDPLKYNLFGSKIYAQELFDIHRQRIKAVYTFFSTSVILGSFLGIPSYTFYRYLCNRAGIEKFDNLFDQDNTKSKFLFHVADLRDIGKIDNLKFPIMDSKKSEAMHRQVLNI